MFWNLFEKKEEINNPEFISIIPCNEFIDSTILLSLLNENDFNNSIRDNLSLIEIKKLDLYEFEQKKISVGLYLFLSDKKDISKNHDYYRGGDLIGKIDALKLYLLCLKNTQVFGELYLQSKKKDFILNKNLNQYFELKPETELSAESLTTDCLNFISMYSTIMDFLSKNEKSKLQKSNVSFLIIKVDPNNLYLSIIEPNRIEHFFSVKSLLEAVRFTLILDLEIPWNQYLKTLKLDTYLEAYIEKEDIEEEDVFISFYCYKKGIDIKKWANGELNLITIISAEEYLNQAQITTKKINKLIESIENNSFIITPQITEYLIYLKQNKGIDYGTEADRIHSFAKRYLKEFDGICRPLSQLDKSTLSNWEVLVTTW